MTVENANYIGGLIRTSPTPQDFKKEGDDQIRLIKSVLLNSVLGFPGAVVVQGVDSGAANAYVLNPPQPLLSYTVGTMVLMTPANTNGGASTLNISSLGARPIQRIDGTAVANGDLMPGVPALMAYDGTAFRMLSVTKAYIDSLAQNAALPGQTGNAGKPLITNGTTASFSTSYGVAIDEAKGTAIAATPTLNLNTGTGTGNFTHITGTGVTINAITLPAGAERSLIIDSAGNTFANGATLDIPGAANIATLAGDRLTVRGDGTKAIVTSYTRANGRAVVEQTAPGWVLLSSAVPAAGVSVIDFLNVFTSTYDDYVVLLDGISSSTAGSPGIGDPNITVQVARLGVVDSGLTYMVASFGETASAQSSSVIVVNGIASPSSATWAEILFLNANSTQNHGIETRSFTGSFGSTGRSVARHAAHFNNGSTSPLSGFRLTLIQPGTPGSHVFAATGTIKIYGIRKV
jgi:hypothetical protein